MPRTPLAAPATNNGRSAAPKAQENESVVVRGTKHELFCYEDLFWDVLGVFFWDDL